MGIDETTFEHFVETYWPVAERVARNILGDPQLAQDIAQDVFADIFVQRSRYEPRFTFHAYVAAIARYKSIDLLRRRRLHAVKEPDCTEDLRTPENVIIERMFRGALYTAVEQLPQQQRNILKAYALEERSYREIAAELGLSVAQVKITLHRIRKVLRRVRDEWGINE